MISIKMESKAEKMEKIRSKADLTFELFQKEMCKFLVVPSSDDSALMYVDFSDVMRRRSEFESSYQAAMSGLNILAEKQQEASAISENFNILDLD